MIIINHSTNKKSANYSVFTHIIETNSKTPKFKFNESELLSIRIFLAKFTVKMGQKKYLLSILF